MQNMAHLPSQCPQAWVLRWGGGWEPRGTAQMLDAGGLRAWSQRRTQPCTVAGTAHLLCPLWSPDAASAAPTQPLGGGGTGPTASELKRIFFFYNYFAFSFLHFSNCILSGVSRQATRRAFFSSESTSSRADSNPCFRLTLQLAKGGRRPLKSRSSS